MFAAGGSAALLGLLHATAAGAAILGGLALAVPEVLDVGNAVDAVGHVVAFGLASLRVSLESGEVRGTFAPLSGLLLTLWGIASAVRRGSGAPPGHRIHHVAATGAAFSAACAGAAAGGGAMTTVEASIPGAALAGLLWGSLGAALGTYRNGVVPGPPSVAPGLVAASVAAGLAGVWFLVAVVVGVAGGSAREIAGSILIALALAPNAAAALVAIGLGGSVDVVLSGTALADPLRDSFALWGDSGAATAHVLILVLAPFVAVLAGGRVAASVTPATPAIVRGLRNGAVLGTALVVAGWAGSLSTTAGSAGALVSAALGFSEVTVFALALAWGVAGAYLGPRLPRWGRASKVERS